jgi:hypothetical protein
MLLHPDFAEALELVPEFAGRAAQNLCGIDDPSRYVHRLGVDSVYRRVGCGAVEVVRAD